MALAVKSGRGLSFFAQKHHTYRIPTTYLLHTYLIRTRYGMFAIALKYSNLAHSI